MAAAVIFIKFLKRSRHPHPNADYVQLWRKVWLGMFSKYIRTESSLEGTPSCHQQGQAAATWEIDDSNLAIWSAFCEFVLAPWSCKFAALWMREQIEGFIQWCFSSSPRANHARSELPPSTRAGLKQGKTFGKTQLLSARNILHAQEWSNTRLIPWVHFSIRLARFHQLLCIHLLGFE